MVRRSAFTLVELLIVVAIIAILAALLMPVLGQARAMANQAACMSNLRQIALLFEYYADDHEQLYPPATLESPYTWLPGAPKHWQAHGWTEQGGWHHGWALYLSQYVRTGSKDKWNHQFFQLDLFTCPSHPYQPRRPQDEAESIYMSYGINTACLDTNTSSYGAGWPGYGIGIYGLHDNTRRADRYPSPSQTIQVAEHCGLQSYQNVHYNTYNWAKWTVPPNVQAPAKGRGLAPQPPGFAAPVLTVGGNAADPAGRAMRVAHRSVSNFLFVDGHVAAMDPWKTVGPVLDTSIANAWWTGRWNQ